MSGTSTGPTPSGGQTRDMPTSFVTDEEDLDFSTVGEEARMSDVDADAYWKGMMRACGVRSSADSKDFRKEMYKWIIKNSTSTRSAFRSHITVGGRTVRLSKLIGGQIADEDEFRRFMRAESNVRELEATCRHPKAVPVLIEKAKRKGVRPEFAIAAVDVAEYFNLTGGERAEVARFKGGTLPNSTPLPPPTIVREVTAGNRSRERDVPEPVGFDRTL